MILLSDGFCQSCEWPKSVFVLRLTSFNIGHPPMLYLDEIHPILFFLSPSIIPVGSELLGSGLFVPGTLGTMPSSGIYYDIIFSSKTHLWVSTATSKRSVGISISQNQKKVNTQMARDRVEGQNCKIIPLTHQCPSDVAPMRCMWNRRLLTFNHNFSMRRNLRGTDFD